MPFRTHGISVGGLADVVHGPEGFEAGRERSLDKVVVTVRVAGELLSGVVGAGVGGVLRVELLLAAESQYDIKLPDLPLPQFYDNIKSDGTGCPVDMNQVSVILDPRHFPLRKSKSENFLIRFYLGETTVNFLLESSTRRWTS